MFPLKLNENEVFKFFCQLYDIVVYNIVMYVRVGMMLIAAHFEIESSVW